MPAIDVSHIRKSFGTAHAVADVSFSLEPGEILGLLGPNGSGKTTSIRLILDIFKPDSGTVSILGGPMTEKKKDRIGYMPEERGLYQETTLERALTYLALLKGLPVAETKKRLHDHFDRFDLTAHRNKKVKELSKGMQQKAQIISTIIHRPEILIVDEPLTGLDPINTQMVKELFREMRREGTSILMSTHQMHQVEELCDRIVLIDQGRSVLYGKLTDIRRQFSGHAVMVRSPGNIPPIEGVVEISEMDGATKLTLAADTDPQSVLDALREKNIVLERFEIAAPRLDDIFIRVVENASEK